MQARLERGCHSRLTPNSLLRGGRRQQPRRARQRLEQVAASSPCYTPRSDREQSTGPSLLWANVTVSARRFAGLWTKPAPKMTHAPIALTVAQKWPTGLELRFFRSRPSCMRAPPRRSRKLRASAQPLRTALSQRIPPSQWQTVRMRKAQRLTRMRRARVRRVRRAATRI